MIGRKSAVALGMYAGLDRHKQHDKPELQLHDNPTDSTKIAVMPMVNTADVTHVAGEQPFSPQHHVFYRPLPS